MKFVFECVRISSAPHLRTAHMVDDVPTLSPPTSQASDSGADEEDEHARLLRQLLDTEDVKEQVEMLAFMKEKGFRPPGRGQGGPRRGPAGKLMPRTGPGMPPRGRADMSNLPMVWSPYPDTTKWPDLELEENDAKVKPY